MNNMVTMFMMKITGADRKRKVKKLDEPLLGDESGISGVKHLSIRDEDEVTGIDRGSSINHGSSIGRGSSINGTTGYGNAMMMEGDHSAKYDPSATSNR